MHHFVYALLYCNLLLSRDTGILCSDVKQSQHSTQYLFDLPLCFVFSETLVYMYCASIQMPHDEYTLPILTVILATSTRFNSISFLETL